MKMARGAGAGLGTWVLLAGSGAFAGQRPEDVPPAAEAVVPARPGGAADAGVPAQGELVAPPPVDPETGRHVFEETLVVEGQEPPRYGPAMQATTTRSDVALRDVPQSVQVVPRQTLEDQQATRLSGVYANVSGVASYSIYNDFVARGFRTGDNNLLVDGLRGGAFAWHVPNSLATLERVEVLKGPASVLFGAAEPGATVNLVRKAPLQTAAHAVRVSAGSFSAFEGSLDSGGPLDREGRLSYRLNVAVESAGSFRDHLGQKNVLLAPTLAWRPDDATTLTGGVELLADNRAVGWDRGLTAPGGDLGALPVERSLHEPGDFDRNRGGAAFLALEHRLAPRWALHARAQLSLRTEDNEYHQPLWSGVLEDGRTMPREVRHFEDAQRNVSTSAWAQGQVETGALRHRLVAGADVNHFQREYLYQVAREAEGVASIDIFQPVYGATQRTGWRSDNTSREFSRAFGAYVQDQVAVTEWLEVMGALRHERYQGSSRWVDNRTGEGAPDPSSASAWVPRAGVVVRPLASTSLFAGYSQSFKPQLSNSPEAGGPFEPERARQWEVGVKQELLRGRLAAQLVAYDIVKRNVLVADPASPERLLQAGRVLSRGLELDVTGTPVHGLSLLANWAVNDARVVEGDPSTVGQRLANAPRQAGAFWARYDVQAGWLSGVGLGGGVRYVGKRATPTEGFELPAHALVGAAGYYRTGALQVALNVDNVLNTRHYLGAYGHVGVFPGTPRSARLTVTQGF